VAADAPEFFKRYFKCVTITATATEVVIQTNDLPPHLSNYYGDGHPNYAPFDSSRGSQYRANPNALGSQNVKLTIPLNPTSRNLTITQVMVDGVVKSNAQEYPMGAAGVALDSVVLYNPLAAPGDDIENEKYTFDSYNAHPDPSKTYHYHTTSKGPLEVLQKLGLTTNTTPGSGGIELYGIMCDGTVVLGCKELDGTTPAANRDPQGGHVHDIADAEKRVYFAGRYHTHVCESGTGNRKFTPEIQYYSTCNLTK
jgi:hypothetical protein